MWQPRANGERGYTERMRLSFLLCFLSLVLLLPLACNAPESAAPLDPGTLASGPLRVAAAEAQSDFPTGIVFRLTLASETPVQDVTLRYFFRPERVVYARPTVQQVGNSVQAEYVLRLTNTSPGYVLEYWYEVANAGGERLETPHTTMVYLDSRLSWQQVSRNGLTVYYHGSAKSKAEALLRTGQEDYERVRAVFGRSLPGEWRIFLYNDVAAVNQAMAMRSQTLSQSNEFSGFAIPESASIILAADALNDPHVLAHEIAHLLIHREASPLEVVLPSWVDEGLAEYLSAPDGTWHASYLRDLVSKGDLLSLSTMHDLPATPSQVSLFYAQSWSIVRFLVLQQGMDRMQAFVHAFATPGVQVDGALLEVYGLNRSSLERAWLDAQQRAGR